MTYQDQLKSPFWQRKRLEIFSRDEFKCKSCGNTESQLHIHHGVYIKGLLAWEYENKYLHTVCENCHDITSEFMKVIYKQIGEFEPSILWDLEWIFDWIKTNEAQDLRRWIIEKQNKEL